MSKVHLEVTIMKIIGELKAERVHDLNQIGGLQEENARLKAEVERLKNNCDYLDTKLDEELDKSAMLSGQVERLTDAITRGAITPDAEPHA